MAYNIPTLKSLIEAGLIDLQSSLDTVLAKFGIEQALNTSVSGSVRDLYDYQSWIVRQILPTSESDDQTIIDTAQTEGIIRKEATYASGAVTFEGTSTIDDDTEMVHSDGSIYIVTSSEVTDSNVIAYVESEESGVDYNVSEDETLTLVSTVTGVSSSGTVTTAISGGTDIETVSEVLERLLYRKRNPPMGGAVADYVSWCREVSGVTRAWSYDLYQGGSTVGYAFVFDDLEDIAPTDTDIEDMDEYLYRHQDPATNVYVGKPAGIEAIYIGLTLTSEDLDITISPDTNDNREAVEESLDSYYSSLSPGETRLISALRTAIGSVDDIDDYTLNVSEDAVVEDYEMYQLGTVTWE